VQFVTRQVPVSQILMRDAGVNARVNIA